MSLALTGALAGSKRNDARSTDALSSGSRRLGITHTRRNDYSSLQFGDKIHVIFDGRRRGERQRV